MDLREADTEQELYDMFLDSELSSYLDLKNSFTPEKVSMIEDAAFFVRLCEIRENCFFNINNQDELLIVYNLLDKYGPKISGQVKEETKEMEEKTCQRM